MTLIECHRTLTNKINTNIYIGNENLEFSESFVVINKVVNNFLQIFRVSSALLN